MERQETVDRLTKLVKNLTLVKSFTPTSDATATKKSNGNIFDYLLFLFALIIH